MGNILNICQSQNENPKNEGDLVPDVTFRVRVRDPKSLEINPYLWKNVTTSDLFAGKRCVVVCLPGAFTPKCSANHLPSYQENYEEIRKYGVDEVYCISVNDPFVMRQWGYSMGLIEEKEKNDNPLNPGNFKTVKLVPDGACTFTKAMGTKMSADDTIGLGERSWRYSMVVNNMVIEKLFIEGGATHNDLLVSTASSMLTYLRSAKS